MAFLTAMLLATAPLIAVPGLSGVGFDQPRTEFFSEHVAQQLRSAGVQVVTNKEISALLGMERQRQLLGCQVGTGACMTELADALGAEAVLLGSLAKLDDGTIQMNVKIIRSNGASLGARSARVSNEGELTDALTAAAYELARACFVTLRPAEPVPASVDVDVRRAPARSMSWLPALIGVGGAAVGAVMLVQASQAHTQLTTQPEVMLTNQRAEEIAQAGRTSQLVGGIALGVGALGLATAASMFFFKEQPIALQAAIGPRGAAVAVSGVFP